MNFSLDSNIRTEKFSSFPLLLRFLQSSKGVESEIFDFARLYPRWEKRRTGNWKNSLLKFNLAWVGKLFESLLTKFTIIFSEGLLQSQPCFSTWCEIALYANNPTRICESLEFHRKSDEDLAALRFIILSQLLSIVTLSHRVFYGTKKVNFDFFFNPEKLLLSKQRQNMKHCWSRFLEAVCCSNTAKSRFYARLVKTRFLKALKVEKIFWCLITADHR